MGIISKDFTNVKRVTQSGFYSLCGMKNWKFAQKKITKLCYRNQDTQLRPHENKPKQTVAIGGFLSQIQCFREKSALLKHAQNAKLQNSVVILPV